MLHNVLSPIIQISQKQVYDMHQNISLFHNIIYASESLTRKADVSTLHTAAPFLNEHVDKRHM